MKASLLKFCVGIIGRLGGFLAYFGLDSLEITWRGRSFAGRRGGHGRKEENKMEGRKKRWVVREQFVIECGPAKTFQVCPSYAYSVAQRSPRFSHGKQQPLFTFVHSSSRFKEFREKENGDTIWKIQAKAWAGGDSERTKG